MDIVIHAQGYIFPDNIVIFWEISLIHMTSGIGETISVFTPNYQLNKQEFEIVNTCVNEKHGLKFEKYLNYKSLWINNDDVKTILNKYILYVEVHLAVKEVF